MTWWIAIGWLTLILCALLWLMRARAKSVAEQLRPSDTQIREAKAGFASYYRDEGRELEALAGDIYCAITDYTSTPCVAIRPWDSISSLGVDEEELDPFISQLAKSTYRVEPEESEVVQAKIQNVDDLVRLIYGLARDDSGWNDVERDRA